MLRVSRLKGCNGRVWAKFGRRVRASGVVLARCWSRMIAARISSMVKIPFAWRVGDFSCALRVRSKRLVVGGPLRLVVRQRSKRSREGCHACQGSGDKRVP
jgi:hypothetical protein